FQKRKTSYRKGVTSTTLDEYPVPKENEILARISNPRGGNVFEVELPDGQKVLAILPTKFNKLIWMKRGDYVIVTKSEGQFTTSSGKQNGVESMIQHILLKDQVNHIKKEGLWPKEWTQSAAAEEETEKAVKKEEEQSDDSDSSDSSFSLEGNPNRRRFYVESDDSE
ncbi:hypothetical protein WA577_007239, partial [Blastocystis sp. JDR]